MGMEYLAWLKCCFNCNLSVDREVHHILCPVREWHQVEQNIKHLESLKVDVEKQAHEQEKKEPLVEIKQEVKRWIKDVERMTNSDVERFRKDAVSWSCFRFVCCVSNWRLGETILETSSEVEKLIQRHKDWKGKYVIELAHRTIKYSLEREIISLKNKKEDVQNLQRKQLLESGMQPLKQVDKWFKDVDSLDKKVASHLLEYHSTNPDSSTDVELRRKAGELLAEIRELYNKDFGGNLVVHSPQLATIKETLKEKREELKNASDDMERRVSEKELNPQMTRSEEVKAWFEKVKALLTDTNQEIQEANRDIQLINEASDMIGKIDKLNKRCMELVDGDKLVVWEHPQPVEEIPASSTPLVGVEDTVKRIIEHLKNDRNEVIGIYGPGGIGKTSILKEINNSSVQNPPGASALFIWVKVSRNQNRWKIQEDIGVRLGYPRRGDSTPSRPSLPVNTDHDRANLLCKILSKKRFVLLLDDLWSELDLAQVGIPNLETNRSKVVFTTREEKVCIGMEATQIIKLDYLNEEMSHLLFWRTHGNSNNVKEDDEIKGVATEVINKCGGSPLALLALAKAMANRRTPEEWRHARNALDSCPDEIQGFEKRVLHILKFSFDNLEDDNVKSCLLFCCLFREDAEINMWSLIDYWIGEGLLDGKSSNSLSSLRDKGRTVITDLQGACLLERCSNNSFVNIHDTVRDMGIWLGQGGGEYKNKFKSFAGRGRGDVIVDNDWKELRRISLGENIIPRTGIVPPQSQLHGLEVTTENEGLMTLLLSYNRGLADLDGLKHLITPSLRVLDLQETSVTSLPRSLTSSNQRAMALRYLDVSGTLTRELHLENFPNLRQLDASYTRELEAIFISKDIIINLWWFDIYQSNYNMFEEREGQLTIETLNGMPQLEEVALTIGHKANVNQMEMLKRVGNSVTKLILLHQSEGFTVDRLLTPVTKMLRLATLVMESCKLLEPTLRLSQIKHVRRLKITDCSAPTNLAWLVWLPCLEVLHLNNIEELVELLQRPNARAEEEEEEEEEEEGRESNTNNYINDDDFANKTFSRLRSVQLYFLPRLTCISPIPLLLPSLTGLDVFGCDKLKKIALKEYNAENNKEIEIECYKDWWERLEWDSDVIQSRCTTRQVFK